MTVACSMRRIGRLHSQFPDPSNTLIQRSGSQAEDRLRSCQDTWVMICTWRGSHIVMVHVFRATPRPATPYMCGRFSMIDNMAPLPRGTHRSRVKVPKWSFLRFPTRPLETACG
jgi:hypothetical protein